MRFFMFARKAITFGLMASLIASAAYAQPPGGGGRGGRGMGMMGMGMGMGGGGGVLGLVRMDEVRKELNVDDETKKKIDELLATMNKEMEALRPQFDFRNASDDERAEFAKKMQEAMPKIQEVSKKLEKQLLDDILDPDQQERALGLLVQREGVRSVMSSEKIAEAIALTEDQKKQMAEKEKENGADMQKAMEEMRGGGGGQFDFAGMRTKMEEMRKKSEERLASALTKEQMDKLDKMKGDKFEFPQPSFGGGRGGPGGPGGGGRPGGRPGGGGGRPGEGT